MPANPNPHPIPNPNPYEIPVEMPPDDISLDGVNCGQKRPIIMCVSLQDRGWHVLANISPTGGAPQLGKHLITAMPVNILAFFNMYRTHAKTEVAIIVLALTWYWSNA